MRCGTFHKKSDPAVGTELVPAVQQTDGLAPVLTRILDALDDIRDRLSGSHKEMYTVDEVASLTGRTPYTVRRWIADGRLTATRVSGTGPRGRLLVARDQLYRLTTAGLGGKVPATVG